MGPHKLSVVYNGDSTTTPLSLTHLVVQNGTAAQDNGNGAQEPQPQPNHKTNIGAIVGGVVSAVVVIILLILAFVFFRRRQRQRAKRGSLDLNEDNTTTTQPFPFQYSPVPQNASAPFTSPSGLTSNVNMSETNSSYHTNSMYGGIAAPSSGYHRATTSAGSRTDLQSSNGTESSTNPHSHPSGQVQSLSGKAREAMAERGQSSSSVTTPRFVRHEDSGARGLNQPATTTEEVVELPPQYTPG